jgi:hypothetical protein
MNATTITAAGAANASTTPPLDARSRFAGALPHFVYHAFHLDLLATDVDRVLQTVILGFIPALWILYRLWMPATENWHRRAPELCSDAIPFRK